MNFDISQNSHDVLSESNIKRSVLSEQDPKSDLDFIEKKKQLTQNGKKKLKNPKELKKKRIKGNSKLKKGTVEYVDYMSPIGEFRNSGMFPQYRKNQWLEIVIDMRNQAGPKANQIHVEPIPPTPIEPKPDIPISINIPFSIDDPFTFDDDVLYSKAEDKLNKFIDDINNLKDSDVYPIEVVDAYYEFLKTKTIIVRGYASIDALSNYEITGSDLTSCGGKKQLRKDYNKCLSKVRAEAIIEKLKSSDGILSELNYVAQGMGETNQFSGKEWDNNVANPTKDKKSPFTTEETKKDRKFIIKLPTFTYKEEPSPTPPPSTDDGGFTPPKITRYNPQALKLMFGDNYEQGPREVVRVKEQGVQSLMDSKCIKFDDTIPNKQHPFKKDGKIIYPVKGDLVILPPEECHSDTFDIGSFLGIGKKLIPSTIEGGSNALLFNEKDMNDVLGENWENYFFPRSFFSSGTISKISITPKKLSFEDPSGEDNFSLDNNLVSQRKWLYDRTESNQIKISNSVAWQIKPKKDYEGIF